MKMLPEFLKRRNKPLWYRGLKKIHLWLGIGLCIPLVLIGLTGSILVFEHEIDSLIQPQYQLAKGTPHNAGEIISAAQTVAKEGFNPTMLRQSADYSEPASVRFSAKDAVGNAGGQQVLIDPVSLEIFDKDFKASPLRTIQQLHSSLLMREFGGRNIVGWMGIAMLFFGISGIIMWWPKKADKWKKSFTVKRGAKGLRLHRDLHKAVGIWGYAVFIAVSFSGVYLAFPKEVGNILQIKDLRSEPKLKDSENKEVVSLDKAIELAKKELPDSRLIMARIPSKPNQPYRISLAHWGYGDGEPATTVFVSQSGEIAEIRNPQTYSIGETFISWQHAIHAGQGFGFLWKILVFLAGFLPLVFSVTGVSMWLIKRESGKATKKE